MKIAFFTSEVYPFSKTGGLADVSAGLPKALKNKGIDIRIFTPYYKCAESFNPVHLPDSSLKIQIGDTILTTELYMSRLPESDVPVYFVDNKHFFFRDTLYSKDNIDYEDNFSRFVLFQRAAIEYLKILNFKADIVHANDWPTALTPVYLKTIYADAFKNIKTVFTIHNIAYQGIYWVWDMKLSGLPFSLFNWQQLEYYGKMNLMKGAIVFSDAVTTVSPRYAEEILESGYAYGLQDVLREYSYKLSGIVNGADYSLWSPENDRYITFKYNSDNPEMKEMNKKLLCAKAGFEFDDKPLICMISRLGEQKGLWFIVNNIESLMSLEFRLIILGTGDKTIEKRLSELSDKYPDRFKAYIKFDNELSHILEAGSDLYLMPSLFEPCGLNQLYSMKYGTIPIVRKTGGLADTVVDCTPENINSGHGTGFVFENINDGEFIQKIRDALKLYKNKELWKKLISNAMSQNWSWEINSEKYISLYTSLLK